MQVQPFLPSRTVVILPSAPTVTIEASWAIEAGAAVSALATGSLEPGVVTAAVWFAGAVPSDGSGALLQPPAVISALASSAALVDASIMNASNQMKEDEPPSTTAVRLHVNSLISVLPFATRLPMTIARISELERKTTQSGKANAGRWLLEFERQEALRPDPLTGWNGSGDTRPQVKINFGTKEAAIAYCDKRGLQYHVVPAPPERLKLQAYADNFR